ncbi:DUF3597 domain-containing protein [Brackiella oedipodis]|uniref:DUF3597 domain-containing protein n=1 Tax=Brackiella oedipodis TaxID=124225 RepID=UPI00048B4319|nr:DUF3597 domain-containing protein [Brackiella oedipodis]
MSFFSNILNKLGLDKHDDAKQAPQAQEHKDGAAPQAQAAQAQTTQSQAAPQGNAAVSQSDVVAQLEERAKASSQPLNWRTSIVDLLKLLDLDSSLEARKELAKELNCPQELLSDSAKMNTWLHQAVLKKIAENGGNIPQDLLHK